MSTQLEPTLPLNLRVLKTRHITHITAGNPDWEPTQPQLAQLVKDFQDAELTGIFATRSGVRVHNLEVVVPEDIEIAESEVLAAAVDYVTNTSPEALKTLQNAALELKKLRDEQVPTT